ncbi:MAG: hypothetical protein ACT4PP_15515, partial [Sporichthyaceae bacterium]
MPTIARPPSAAVSRVVVAAALALGAVPLLGAGPASACSCGALTDKQAAKDAVAVFAGTLIDTQLPPPSDVRSSDDPVTYTFAVSRVYQGNATDPQRVRSIVGGEACGLELRGTGPYLVFATKPTDFLGAGAPGPPEDGLLAANLCGGTREITAQQKPALGKGKPPAPPPPTRAVAAEPDSADDDLPGWALPFGFIAIAAAAGLGVAAMDRRRRT